MKPQSPAIWAMLSLVLILPCGASAPAVSQINRSPPWRGGAKWGLIDGIGYGGLGFGIAVAATLDMESNHFGPPGAALVIIGASIVAGAVLGGVMGSRAQRTVAAGRPLHGAHRVAVVAGGVIAGGTPGALTSAALIKGEGERSAEKRVARPTRRGGRPTSWTMRERARWQERERWARTGCIFGKSYPRLGMT
jgi:hypothetical protein